ncbi:DUF4124 domain-containing protein [Shewanella schlegeliana]|nr:DUF4124 domain-containing protein [Shewanella schlegeliana]MCL1109534.1 DUF4124 domain-containing protein [Shewanella schlegeliana]GIU33720.1 hypothetical protein TUM4433_28690 [Shewanella schlegeliana]
MIKTIKIGDTKLQLPASTTAIASALLVLSLWSSSSHANVIYTWIDDKGVTHYSQQPPEHTQEQTNSDKLYSEDIEPKQIGTVAPSASIVDKAPTDLENKAAVITQNDQKQAEGICKNAKHSLNVLTTHTKLNKKDASSGKVVAMTEEQRQAAIAEHKQKIKLFCVN